MTTREYIVKKTVEDIDNHLMAVRVFWKDPFDTLGMRVGYFEDYEEAAQFESYLYKTYEESGFPYMTTFRGSVSSHNHSKDEQELFRARCMYKD